MSEFNSKFIIGTDERLSELDDFVIPHEWWSRPHEYGWASKFLYQDDVILDAGCGIEHPFKVYASKRVKKCIAIDEDIRIKDFENTNTLEYVNGNLTNLSMIKDNSIDKVFCISVLEHMYSSGIIDTLKEFKRVLKPDGQIILTIDYPILAPETLINFMDQVGLSFVGDADFTIDKHLVIKGAYMNLKCYRALLCIPEEVDTEKVLEPVEVKKEEIKEKKDYKEIKPIGPSENKKKESKKSKLKDYK